MPIRHTIYNLGKDTDETHPPKPGANRCRRPQSDQPRDLLPSRHTAPAGYDRLCHRTSNHGIDGCGGCTAARCRNLSGACRPFFPYRQRGWPPGGRSKSLGGKGPVGAVLQRQDPRAAWHPPEHRRPDVERFSPYAAHGDDHP